jgi:hypothetical protein
MTESDTPATEPGPLNLDSATEAFAALLDPPKEDETKVDTELDAPEKPDTEVEPEAVEEGADAPITITVDGKQVTLTPEQIADAYKNGLRQSDYTQKTMALAEQRKAAEQEAQKALQERQTYAQNLSEMAAQLKGAIQQQEKIDWNALLEADPVEYLKQQHLFNSRQAALQRNQQEQSTLAQKFQAEQAEAMKGHLAEQQEALLAKLPTWKDPAKASAERDAVKTYLVKEGYSQDDVANINDHKAVLLARKAMLYDQMVAKASAAAKKVQNLPTKVERPGVTETGNVDGRTAAMRRHSKEGSIDSLTDAFRSIL